MSVFSEISRESISVFSFMISISPGRATYINFLIDIYILFQQTFDFKIFFQSILYLSNQPESDPHSFAYIGQSAFLKDRSENEQLV